MTLESFLIAHGSLLILPLAVIEGPVVTAVCGFLSARGYFDWYWVCSLLVCADVIGDLLYYWLGRSAGSRLARLLRRLGLNCVPSPALQRDLARNATKMLLIGKWTHSIGFLVLTGSGSLRVPLLRFFLVNLAASIPKTAVLFGVGYFAGHDYRFFEQHAALTAAVLGILGGSAILLVIRRAGTIRART